MSTNIVEFVNSQVTLFEEAKSDDKIVWAKEAQFAIQAFQKNDFLEKVARSNPSSAQNAIINVAAIGITLNPAAKLAYLVPRDGAVNLDISYMGLLHLAMTTGSIMWGQCKLVYDADTYESNGLDTAPTHKYNAFKERGSVVGGYCTVKTSQGDYLTEEMSLEEIKAVEATSRAKNGPWKTHWGEMARKTIVKRASKYWPKVDRLDAAIHHLNTSGGEGLDVEPEMPVYTEEQVKQMRAEAAEKIASDVRNLCENMDLSETEDELKQAFATAYRMTKDHQTLRQEVQKVYAVNKEKFNATV